MVQSDIIEFNKVLNFQLFSREDLIISLSLWLLAIIIVFVYTKYSQNISNMIEIEIFLSKIRTKYYWIISSLDINDTDFFYKINLNIKSFLEELKLFPWLTKMTKKEILRTNTKISDLKTIVSECEKYEFSQEKNPSSDIKNSLKIQTLNIIKTK